MSSRPDRDRGDTAADAVAAHDGARAEGGLLDGWLLAEEDAGFAPALAATGIHPVVAPLWMRDQTASAAIIDAALGLHGNGVEP